MTNKLDDQILDLIGSTPITANQLMNEIGDAVGTKAFTQRLTSLVASGDVTRIDGEPVAFVSALELDAVEVPTFLKKQEEGERAEVVLSDLPEEELPPLVALPESIEAAFTVMAKPKHVPEQVELKAAVLDRLADLIEPSIAEVLMHIRADLIGLSE